MDIWWNSIQFTALCWLAGFGKAKIFLKTRNNCNRQWNTTFYNNSQIGYKVKEDSELERTSALLLEYSSGQTFDCSVERIRVDEATATTPVQMDQITAGASVVIWSTYPLLQLPDNWIVQQAACFFPPDCVRSHASRTVHTHPSWSPLNRGTSVSTRLQDRVQMFLLQPFFKLL